MFNLVKQILIFTISRLVKTVNDPNPLNTCELSSDTFWLLFLCVALCNLSNHVLCRLEVFFLTTFFL
jgi:hypothetical protein